MRAGIYAVSVLSCACADPDLQSARRKVPGDPDRDGRCIWREGRLPVRDRIPCCVAGDEVRAPGEDDLRPRRGYGGDDETASVAHPAPDSGIEGRQAAGMRD